MLYRRNPLDSDDTEPIERIADPQRLAALASYGILDTPAEEGFDDIVAIAAEVCACPVALIGLVALDRQWIKASVGAGVAAEVAIDETVCAHAISGDADLLQIGDLSRDPRTWRLRSVAGESGIRFYAGLVLASPEGQPLGTLCVIDPSPRPQGLTDGQVAALRALGRRAMALLEQRREAVAPRPVGEWAVVADAIQDRERKLRIALEGSRSGLFDYDLITGRLEWDARTRELYGVAADATITYEGSFLAALHPEDRGPTEAALKAAFDPHGNGIVGHEYRIVLPNGALRWLSGRARAVRIDGLATRLVGTVRDVTQRRLSDDAIAAALERATLVARATNDAIWDWDLVSDHVLWNEALTTSYGYAPDDIETTGQWWLDHVHPEDRQRVSDDIHAVIGGVGADWKHEYRFRRADGAYAEVFDRGYMVRDQTGAPIRMIGAMLDLTERKAAEEQFRTLFEGANIGIVQLDPVTARAIWVNDKLCDIWKTTRADILGQSLARWTPPADDAARAELHGRLARGELMKTLLEKRYRRADGEIIWARVNLVSRRLHDGVQCTAMIEDITEERAEKARQHALVELGARLRDLSDGRAIAEAACEVLGRTLAVDRVSFGAVDVKQATVEIDVDWRVEGVACAVGSHALDRFGDMGETVANGRAFAVADIETDPRTAAHRDGYRALGIRSMLHAPILEHGVLVALFFVHARDARMWSQEVADFVHAVADRTRAAVARARAEDRQRLLNAELSHRMKNLLAMVQAIATQTMRGATDIDDARRVLSARLVALGRAHDVLLGGGAEAGTLSAILKESIALLIDDADRVSISGPDVAISAKAALPLILMMHELGTNAAKYGALSNADGRISITWEVSGEPGAEALRLTWAERGGPPVAPPTRKGFGTRLIEQGLARQMGGSVRIDYDPAGASCLVEAPLAQLRETD